MAALRIDSQRRQSCCCYYLLLFLMLPTHSSSFLLQQSANHQPLPHIINTHTRLYNADTSTHSADASLLTNHSFQEFYPDMPDWLSNRLEECQWMHPTVIQQKTLSALASASDEVVVQAQTGSGKTLAYLLPLLSSLQERAAVQAIIIVPTRELGLQVGRIAKRLLAANPNLMAMNILQGSSNRRQRAWAWSEPPQVAIGTPAEVTEMVQHGYLKANTIQFVVVDEVDACLLRNQGAGALQTSSGPLHTLLSKHLSPTYLDAASVDEGQPLAFLDDSTTPARPQAQQRRKTMFLSATIPQHRHFIKQCLSNQWTLQEPEYICAHPGDVLPPLLRHSYLVAASKERKLGVLRKYLQQQLGRRGGDIKKVLIFCETHRPLDKMAQVIAKDCGGIVWKHGYGKEEEDQASTIVSVLRYEDSVADRMAAMTGFQGTSGGVIQGMMKERYNNDASQNYDAGPTRILLSTDHAARGLDAQDLTHVLQFDLPHEADTYVHRSGRAGRLGTKGWVVSFITQNQEFALKRMSNKLGLGEKIKCAGRQQQVRKKKTTIT